MNRVLMHALSKLKSETLCPTSMITWIPLLKVKLQTSANEGGNTVTLEGESYCKDMINKCKS